MKPVSGFVDFVSRVLGVKLTPAQRVAALVFFDGHEPGDFEGSDRDIARQLFGPVDRVPAGARGVCLLLKGARVGGSYIFGALYSLWRALTADLSTLAPGEQATALVVAPDIRLARQVLRYALGAARSVPAIAALVEAVSADSFMLRRPDGRSVAIEALPATRGGSALRGRSLVSAVLSEASFFRDETAAVNDSELFRAVSPRILPGGLVVLESTPWAEVGLVFELFSANFAAPTTCIACHAPTLLMRPDKQTAAVVAREEQRSPDNAEREFGARFMSGGAGLMFGPELLRPAVDSLLAVRTSTPDGWTASIGGDIGLVNDASAFVAVHALGEDMVAAEVIEIRPRKGSPLKLSEVVAAGCEFAERHGQHQIHVDHHVLEPAREHLPEGFALIPADGGQGPKAERFLRLRECLRQSRMRFPGELARLAGQLGDVVSRPTPGGNLQITLPRRSGTHLDAVAALVLAAWVASRVNGDSTISDAMLVAMGLAPTSLGDVRGLDPFLEKASYEDQHGRWDVPGRGF